MLVTKQISLTIAALVLALPSLAAPAGKCGSGGVQNKAVVDSSSASGQGQGQGRGGSGGHYGHGQGRPSASAGQANQKDDFSSGYVQNDDNEDQTTTTTYVRKTTQMATPTPPADDDEKPVASSVSAAAKPSAAPSAEPSADAPAAAPADGGDWFAIANEWRVKMGHPAFTKDEKLIANALDTVKSSNGQMVHKLNPGSYGQVLAPGQAEDFLHVYVGGWLCELPAAPGLDGICSTQSDGWAYEGQTGHAEILNGGYKAIGCALYAGIWACDLA